MIIAVDFDGVLCEDAFPLIGKPNYEMISIVRRWIDDGNEVILWTCRVDERLKEAVDWCSDYGLHFCTVNENAPSNLAKYPTNPRKVYADVYIDDRDAFYQRARKNKVDLVYAVNELVTNKRRQERIRQENLEILKRKEDKQNEKDKR